jgi:hypothetical protein
MKKFIWIAVAIVAVVVVFFFLKKQPAEAKVKESTTSNGDVNWNDPAVQAAANYLGVTGSSTGTYSAAQLQFILDEAATQKAIFGG